MSIKLSLLLELCKTKPLKSFDTDGKGTIKFLDICENVHQVTYSTIITVAARRPFSAVANPGCNTPTVH